MGEVNISGYLDTLDKIATGEIKLAEIGQRMQWVSVEDRMPDKDMEIFFYANGRVTGSIYYVAREFKDKTITHWMPVPQP